MTKQRMTHQGSDSYDEAVSRAAKTMQKKLEELIHGSVRRVQGVIEQVQNDVPDDAIARGNTLKFLQNEDGIYVHDSLHQLDEMRLHDHALAQIAERVNRDPDAKSKDKERLKIRSLGTVVRDLNAQGAWGRELVAHNLTEIYSHMPDEEKFLMRSVRGELRGFLSDKYRRLDSRPLLESFVDSLKHYGARPVDGFALQTKIKVRAILPYVFEPFPDEIIAIGAQLSDSDYGDGALAFEGVILRMWCTNTAISESVLHQVHLGKRMSENVMLSRRTLELDTQAFASAIKDVAGHVLAPAGVNKYLSMVKAANAEKVKPEEITGWIKKNLTKGEGDQFIEKFNSPDVELLPKGQTVWRWSNALSWLANETKDERRKLDLQDFAGKILEPVEEAA